MKHIGEYGTIYAHKHVVEYLVERFWTLVGTRNSIILYSFDSCFHTLSDCIKKFMVPLQLAGKYRLDWKKAGQNEHKFPTENLVLDPNTYIIKAKVNVLYMIL
jgi:hypothetical protein